MNTSIFNRTKIYGLDYITELCTLSSLLLGDPVIYIGLPGTAKSELVKILGLSIATSYRNRGKKFNFHSYDTTKLYPEDLLSIYSPKSLSEGKLEYMSTAMSIWDKDMIVLEELTRAHESTQNNLLEIVRSRTCCGINLPLKFIYSTINPATSTGADGIIHALADRILFFLPLQDFNRMSYEDKIGIINRVGDMDSVGLREWGKRDEGLTYSTDKINPALLELGDIILDIMAKASEVYEKINADIDSICSDIIIRVSEAVLSKFKNEQRDLSIEDITINGRRCGMMLRAIKAMIAVDSILAKLYKREPLELQTIIKKGIALTSPFGITSPQTVEDCMLYRNAIDVTVDLSWDIIVKKQHKKSIVQEMFSSPSYVKRLGLILSTDKNDIGEDVWLTCWSEMLAASPNIRKIIKLIITLDDKRKIIPEHISNSKAIREVVMEVYRDGVILDIADDKVADEYIETSEKIKNNYFASAILEYVTDDLKTSAATNPAIIPLHLEGFKLIAKNVQPAIDEMEEKASARMEELKELLSKESNEASKV